MANQTEHTQELRKKAEMLLQSTPLIDGHNDLPWQYRTRVNGVVSAIDLASPQPELHTDIPKLKKGLLGGQFWSVYVATNLDQSKYVSATMEQIDLVYDLIDRYRDTLQLALNAEEVSSAFSQRKIASLIGMEGGHCIGNSLGTLRMFYKLGARYLTLTHNRNVGWADSCTDRPESNGLSDFGRDVVREMNRLGILIDLSHVGERSTMEAIEHSEKPVAVTHANCKGYFDRPRNKTDEAVRLLAERGGVVGATAICSFLKTQFESTLDDYLDAIDDMVQRIGPDQVGVGIDFTQDQPESFWRYIGSQQGTSYPAVFQDPNVKWEEYKLYPDDLTSPDELPNLASGLQRRGYSGEEITGILGGNWLRLFGEVWEGA